MNFSYAKIKKMDTKYNPKNLEFDTYIFYHWYEIEKLTHTTTNGGKTTTRR